MSDLSGRHRSARSRAAPSAIARRRASRASWRVRERVALLLDEGSFAEEALLANWQQDGLGADGVVTGVGRDRRAPGRADGQRPDRQGRLVGAEDGREDPAHPGARA